MLKLANIFLEKMNQLKKEMTHFFPVFVYYV